jgi:hypothetical protein
MAREKHEPKHVVLDVVDRGSQIGRARVLPQIGGHGLRLAARDGIATESVDGAALGDRHQPRRGVGRDALVRPLAQCRNESILREVLREADVAGHAG